MTTDTSSTTELGSYFISNYPPFSLWDQSHVPKLEQALNNNGFCVIDKIKFSNDSGSEFTLFAKKT